MISKLRKLCDSFREWWHVNQLIAQHVAFDGARACGGFKASVNVEWFPTTKTRIYSCRTCNQYLGSAPGPAMR